MNATAATALFNTDGSLVDAVDTNGNATPDGIPDAAEGTPPLRQITLPNTYLVTATDYYDTAATGPIVDTINNAGVVTETLSDLMGRTIRTIQNFDGLAYGAAGTPGSGFDVNANVGPSAANMSQDVTTDSLYDTLGRLAATVAYNVTKPSASVVVVPQITSYLYESPIDASLPTNQVAPDSTDNAQAVGVTLSQSGGVATAITSFPNQYLPGDWVWIQGASDARYNGWFQVTTANSTQFTYSVPVATAASGSGTAQALVAWDNVSSLTWNSTTQTATVTVANNYQPGQWVSIQGANESQFDGWFQVATASPTQFTFSLASAPALATGTIRVRLMADQTQTAFDLEGRTLRSTDQRGVTHQYSYDSVGHETNDAVTNFGSIGTGPGRNVADIATAYNDLGQVQTVTSYPNANGSGAPVNQVEDAYDGWGNLIQQWQATTGAVSNGSTPSVQYGYGDGAGTSGVAAYRRLQQVTYPSSGGRMVNYNYAAGVDAIMSRLSSITESGGITDASYSYLGANAIVKEDYGQAGVNLNYDPAGNDSFSGLDCFGRVLQQIWSKDGNSSSVLDQYNYTYNGAGDRVSRLNAVNTAMSELYGYDSLDRLTSAQRGMVVGGTIASPTMNQAWQLDSLGNFTTFNNTGTQQARTANSANEISSINGTNTGSDYDAAGNMVVVPNTSNPSQGQGCTYDAWNRLVQVCDSSGNIQAQYQYDGAGRRIAESTDFTVIDSTSYPQAVTYFFFSGQNAAETRSATFTAGDPAPSPESLAPSYQNVFSPVSGKTPILRDTYSGGSLVPDDRLYYLTDANTNVTAVVGLLDSTWVVQEHYVYDPYGAVTVYGPSWSNPGATSSTSINNTLLYASMVLDPATGLYYDEARWYSTSVSTFISRDPAEADLNLYLYVEAAPTQGTDPDGLLTWKNDPTITIVSNTVRNYLGSGQDLDWSPTVPKFRKANAVTVPRLDISFAVCKKMFSLFTRLVMPPGITVKFWNEIYLRPTYPSEQLRAWVMRAENDHVGDYTAWANGPGKAAAAAEEAVLAREWYLTASTAGWGISKGMKAALWPSLEAALLKSVADWDTTGKHTYGGPNQRP